MRPMPLPELTSVTLADQAYEALRTAILSGDLTWGERITERGLAARLGVSATPVREALRRLEQERLIERNGPRAILVATISPQLRAESAEMEAALEAVAAKLAARKISENRLDQLDQLLDAADAERAKLLADHEQGRELDAEIVERLFNRLREFHAIVEAAADNNQLTAMLQQARAFSRDQRLRAATNQIAERSPALLERYGEHRELAATIRARDEAAAERLAHAHALSAAADLLTPATPPSTE